MPWNINPLCKWRRNGEFRIAVSALCASKERSVARFAKAVLGLFPGMLRSRLTAALPAIIGRIALMRNALPKLMPSRQNWINDARLQRGSSNGFNHSNAIEGNTLTLQETALVLEGITIDKKPLKDHLEAIGHKDAFLYVQDLVKKQIPFSESIIKQIHTLVLMDRPEDRGIYRHIPVRIMGAYHVPPDPVLVPEQMENLIAAFTGNTNLHPIGRAAWFHLNFEGIHPFVDGNGRTGRLILNLMLMQSGYPPINVKYSDRKRYYEAFDTYFRDNSEDGLVYLISELLRERLFMYLCLSR